MNRTGLSLSLVFAAVALSAACGSSNPPPPTTQPQPYAGGYPPPAGQPGYPPPGGQPGYPPPGGQPGYPPPGGQPGAPPPQPGQPGQPPAQPGQPGGAPSGNPGGLPFPIPGMPGAPPSGGGGAAGGTAQPLDPNLAGLATGPLQLMANSQAPGMTKEGAPVAGNFQAGQTLESTFTFQPGKCYTLLASGVGITQLDLEMQYVTPVPGLSPSVGKSSTRGAQASIGAGNNCLKPLSPFPAQAKYIVRATSGQGVAAAQLYSK